MKKVMKKEGGNMDDGATEVMGGQRRNKRQRDVDGNRGEAENERLNESLIHQRHRQRERGLVGKCPVESELAACYH